MKVELPAFRNTAPRSSDIVTVALLGAPSSSFFLPAGTPLPFGVPSAYLLIPARLPAPKACVADFLITNSPGVSIAGTVSLLPLPGTKPPLAKPLGGLAPPLLPPLPPNAIPEAPSLPPRLFIAVIRLAIDCVKGDRLDESTGSVGLSILIKELVAILFAITALVFAAIAVVCDLIKALFAPAAPPRPPVTAPPRAEPAPPIPPPAAALPRNPVAKEPIPLAILSPANAVSAGNIGIKASPRARKALATPAIVFAKASNVADSVSFLMKESNLAPSCSKVFINGFKPVSTSLPNPATAPSVAIANADSAFLNSRIAGINLPT